MGKFIKTVTYRASPAGEPAIAPIVSRICEAEGMMAHKFTADVRTQRYD